MRIFVGINEITAVLHWQVFSVFANLPGVPPVARLRAAQMAYDYDALIRHEEGTPYTLHHGRDRLVIVEIDRLHLTPERDLQEFYDTRDNLPQFGPAGKPIKYNWFPTVTSPPIDKEY